MGINWRLLAWLTIAGIILVWLMSDPTSAASDVKGIFQALKDAANSIILFVKEVLNG